MEWRNILTTYFDAAVSNLARIVQTVFLGVFFIIRSFLSRRISLVLKPVS